VPDHAFLFRAPAEARGIRLPLVAGALPPGLRGTLLRNGPGVQHAGRTPVHFLDGYATVASARFEDDGVTLNVRHVDLPLARREQAAGRLLGRRPFTNRPGGRLANLGRMQLSTGAAHEVYAWGGAVVAADVDGHYLLDARTLETRGPAPINALGGGLAQLSPMPRLDPHSGNLVAYVMKPGVLGSDTVTFVEFDDQWRERARVQRSLGVKGALLHDLVATEHHYLVVQFGLLSVPRAAAGGMVVLDAVGLPPGSARVLVVPRRGDGPILAMPLPDGFQGFHLANAWEEDGRLVADTTVYQGQLDFDPLNPPGLGRGGPMPGATKDPGGPWLCRPVLDLSSGAHQVTMHRQAAGEAPCVREDLTGRRTRYAWVSAPGTPGDEPVRNAYYWDHGVAKLDAETGTTASLWDAGPRVYVTAPQFVARGAAEDDGWLLAWTHDAAGDRGELVVLDAADPAAGPLARLALPASLPPASHVGWIAG
jgi:carotenoid cleavage dioxygenase-like enzyme